MINTIFRVVVAAVESIAFLPFGVFCIVFEVIKTLCMQIKRFVKFEIELFDGALGNGAHIDLSVYKKELTVQEEES